MPPMVEFQSALLFCGLMNLGYNGYRFTWRNGRAKEAFVEERLDRACASAKWSEIHPRAKVIHLTASYSDHETILLDTTPVTAPTPHRRHKLHLFEQKWVSHLKCELIIRGPWTHSIVSGSPMNRLFEKIKQCRSALVTWSQHTFGNTWIRFNAKQQELKIRICTTSMN